MEQQKTVGTDSAFPDDRTGTGLTKREYFAAKILTAVIDSDYFNLAITDMLDEAGKNTAANMHSLFCGNAVILADQLIEALNADVLKPEAKHAGASN